MGKKASGQATENRFYKSRIDAAEADETFTSREKASLVLGIDRTRLARIEGDTVLPHPDEVAVMAKCYGDPALPLHYCAENCPLGRGRTLPVDDGDLDRLTLRVLGSLQSAGALTEKLVAITSDGKIEKAEEETLREVLELLDNVAAAGASLKLWAEKHTSI